MISDFNFVPQISLEYRLLEAIVKGVEVKPTWLKCHTGITFCFKN